MTRTEDADPFVGRAHELGLLADAIANARGGVPSVVLIAGDAGMGKSTLVSEAASRAGARLVVGRSIRLGGEVVPLAPLADLLRQLRRVAPAELADTDGLARFGPVGVASLGPASERPSAEGVFAPVLDLFGRLGRDDVVVVAFEDIHWADGTTWDLFELLARNLTDERVVMIGTYRSDEVARDTAHRRRIAELARVPWVTRLELRGLDHDDLVSWVARIGGRGVEPAVVDDVLRRGEGNPFFTAELVRAHLGGDEVPDVLSDLIAADLAALDEPTLRVLDAASAIGREVSHDLLAAVVGDDDTALETALRSAIDAQVLLVDRAVDGYRFRHALIAEVVYARLLPSQSRRLHRRIADALEQYQDGATAAGRSAQRALHLDRAGDVSGAFTALLEAADAAHEIAPAVALRQLERALELWDGADGGSAQARCERLWQAAELATGAVGNDRAVALAREAFRWGIPERGAAWAHERLGRYLWASGELDASRAEFRAAADLMGTDGSTEGTVSAMAGLAQAALMDADIAGAERWCQSVLDRVPSAGDDPAAWVMATRVLAAARADQGDITSAVALGRSALAAAPTPYARAMAAAYFGIVLVEAGDYADALAVAGDGGGDARLAGLDRSFGAYFDSEVAEVLMRMGSWAQAGAAIHRRDAVGFGGFHPGRIRMLVTAAVMAARSGRTADAAELLGRAVEAPADRFHEPLIAAAVAEVHLASGDWSAAALAADAGWHATARRRPWWAVRFAMLSACASTELGLDARAARAPFDADGEVARMQRRLDDAASAVGDDGMQAPSIAAQLTHARAMLSLLTGTDPLLWERSAAAWQALPDPWMTADARLREVDAWLVSGDAAHAASALREAHVIALELSSTVLLERVEAVSRRTRISVESAELVVVNERSADRLGLTPREAEVLGLVAAGQTNKQIGAALYVSEKTASVHVSNILRKLGVSTRVEAAAVAQRLGLE